MAARISGGVLTISTSPQSIGSLLGIPGTLSSNATLQAGSANAGIVYIGGSAVTGATDAYAFLSPSGFLGEILFGKFVDLANLYAIGTSGDKLHVLAIQ